MIAQYKYVIGAGIVALLGLGVWWYGVGQYGKGYEAAKVEMERLAQKERQRLQEARDEAELKWREAEMARVASEKLIDDQRGRIDRLLRDLARKNGSTQTASAIDGTGTSGVGILTSCVREYDQMGRDAARLADKVNGLQEYVRAVTSEGDE